MDEFTQILATIRRPFQQEVRNGGQNNVVINGLGSYVKLWVEKARQFSLNLIEEQAVDKLANLFDTYERLSPTERLKIIEDARAQIDAMMPQKAVKSPTKTRAIRRPSAVSRAPIEELPLFQSTSQPPVTRVKAPAARPKRVHGWVQQRRS